MSSFNSPNGEVTNKFVQLCWRKLFERCYPSRNFVAAYIKARLFQETFGLVEDTCSCFPKLQIWTEFYFLSFNDFEMGEHL